LKFPRRWGFKSKPLGVVTSCGVQVGYQRFGELAAYIFTSPWRSRWYPTATLHVFDLNKVKQIVLNQVPRHGEVSLCLTERHAGKTYGDVEVQLHALTSAKDEGQWSASCPTALPRAKEPPVPTAQKTGWAAKAVWTWWWWLRDETRTQVVRLVA
jgi:hypothetical protein